MDKSLNSEEKEEEKGWQVHEIDDEDIIVKQTLSFLFLQQINKFLTSIGRMSERPVYVYKN